METWETTAGFLLHCFAGWSVAESTLRRSGSRSATLSPDPIYPPRTGTDGSIPTACGPERGSSGSASRPVRWLSGEAPPLGLPSLMSEQRDISARGRSCHGSPRGDPRRARRRPRGGADHRPDIGDEDESSSRSGCRRPQLAAGLTFERIARWMTASTWTTSRDPGPTTLSKTVERGRDRLIVFDQVLDHVSGGENGSGVLTTQERPPGDAAPPPGDGPKTESPRPVCSIGSRSGQELSRPDRWARTSSTPCRRSSLSIGRLPPDRTRRVPVQGRGDDSAAPGAWSSSGSESTPSSRPDTASRCR